MTTASRPAGSSTTATPLAAIVQIDRAVKRFGETVALNELSLRISRGESHGLVGRNGAGKSTLVSVPTGLRAIDSSSGDGGARPAPSDAMLGAKSSLVYHRTLVPT
jgi:simple sugar transport system ATP-binding protein